MNGRQKSGEQSLRAVRSDLSAALRDRRAEIDKATMTRIRRLADPVGEDDPAYAAGLRAAVSTFIGYGIEGIENGPERPLPIPSAVTAQARREARAAISLHISLRRYFVGARILEEFIVAEADGISRKVLGQILGDQGPQIDRLLAAVAAEYEDEFDRGRRSLAQREAERIVELVQSDSPVVPVDLDFDFTIWHVGAILRGREPGPTARTLASRSGCRSLHVVRDRETAWVWLSSIRRPSLKNLESLLTENMPPGISVAIGEPREGLEGWRLTHREAEAALRVTLQKPQGLTRGRDVILLAGTMMDETLVRSLLDTYLVPLTRHDDPGHSLLDTLRAYFSAAGNSAAAAVSLGVTRHTVQRRIRRIEEMLGQPLHTCQAELQIALQIEELDGAHGAGVHRNSGNGVR